ncbi:YggS family pyridoxal phosphate-dependent enzyme [Methylobacillus flagellatus]|uniref:YggS family pyridoxal phosphate-dependent enzyme n=1 Tax=Methylobacillus flagellatus TaxID=405 RepID=UPI002853A9EE|nr:YggS family pyridoxal phosphate-dependent enzyme [Methylobacillus flagellatus]MDR5172496.1 YggS family pyridoxal phosphate-dependent enzyme [Methylobacillus flagellatus]
MDTIGKRWQAIKARIGAAALDAGRAPDSVRLLAVSKAHPASAIREVYTLGQRQFGENYLQEALAKQEELQDLAIEWHFIGPIQSNKTQPIARHFDWVHSVDRAKIADRLNAARGPGQAALQVCIQVNVSGEDSKSGTSAADAIALADHIRQLPKLRLRGLMAIPAPTHDPQEQQSQFRAVRDIYDSLQSAGHHLDTLSMGMSEDFPAAVQEGATIVRVGSAIFGARIKPTTEQST